MKLPFFKSRKRKGREEAEEAGKAAEQEARQAVDPAEAEPDKPERQSGKAKTRRVPAEQVVDAFGYALAAVPSLGPTVKAWRKLGFHVSDAYTWQGCHAAHIELEGGGIRFLAADSHAEATSASDLVRQRLILGSGLFGWTWSCSEPHRSAVAIGQLAGSPFHEECEDWSDSIVQIPMELTPAAATWLERPPAETAPPSHANSIVKLDHVVLQVSASKAAAQIYEKHFGLKGRTSAMNDRYYAFLKAGRSLLEIVGPIKPGEAEKPQGKGVRITGGPWGVAFGSTNIDATVTFLRMAGVDVADPHRAVQGGRITGMTTPLGGIQLAFMGD
jgi:predicted enzyme related to lactoylglutathione lyase